jgi:hypothetical protein
MLFVYWPKIYCKENTDVVLFAIKETSVEVNAKKVNVTGDAGFKTQSEISSAVK